MTAKLNHILAALVVIAGLAFVAYLAMPAKASIESPEAYKAYKVYSQQVGTTTLKFAPGVIGSIIISSSSPAQATSAIAFYDSANNATTSNATTTFLFGLSGRSVAAGTYVYDVEFTRGLLVEVTAGFVGELVITYK